MNYGCSLSTLNSCVQGPGKKRVTVLSGITECQEEVGRLFTQLRQGRTCVEWRLPAWEPQSIALPNCDCKTTAGAGHDDQEMRIGVMPLLRHWGQQSWKWKIRTIRRKSGGGWCDVSVVVCLPSFLPLSLPSERDPPYPGEVGWLTTRCWLW